MNKLSPNLLLLTFLGLFLIIGCSNDGQTSSQDQQNNQLKTQEKTQQGKNIVNINNFSFDAPTITIKKSESITWVNQDQAAHTATGKDFDTGNLDTGNERTISFPTPGTYDYVCNYHPNMKGQVVVNEK